MYLTALCRPRVDAICLAHLNAFYLMFFALKTTSCLQVLVLVNAERASDGKALSRRLAFAWLSIVCLYI